MTGYRTSIVRELSLIIDDPVERIQADLSRFGTRFIIPREATRFVLAAGLLHQKQIQDQTATEVGESVAINMVNVMRLCERILTTVEAARICVVGSQSGLKGSYDQTYAACKAAIHQYVINRRVTQHQQIVAIVPGIIADSGMTERRKDYPEVLRVRDTVSAHQVAKTIKRLLYGDAPLSNSLVNVAKC